MPASPLLDPARQLAADLLRQHLPAAVVARQTLLSLRTVQRIAAGLGLGRGPGQRGPASGPRGQAITIVDLLLQGESAETISFVFGITIQHVTRTAERWLSDGDKK